MATEALDLPRGAATIPIRLPRRLRAYVRALRIARIRREHKRQLAAFELLEMEPHVRLRRKESMSWLEELAQTQMQATMLSR